MLKAIHRKSVILICAFLLLSTAQITSAESDSQGDIAIQMVVKVVENVTHQNDAFTQGLLWQHGMMYESTGIYGESTLREVFPNGTVNRYVELAESQFGEGLSIVGEQLIQLTWKENTALIWNLSDFTLVGNFSYDGEGWGLCNNGTSLVMSDGTSQIDFRNPADFSITRSINVTLGGEELGQLNELECDSAHIWANVFQTDELVRINSSTGVVDQVINASSLGGEDNGGYLNGIAFDSEGNMWLTGKNWPKIFKVELELAVEPTDNGQETTEPNQPASHETGSQSCTGDDCEEDAPFGVYMMYGVVLFTALSCAAIGIFKFWRALPSNEKKPLSQGNVFDDDE